MAGRHLLNLSAVLPASSRFAQQQTRQLTAFASAALRQSARQKNPTSISGPGKSNYHVTAAKTSPAMSTTTEMPQPGEVDSEPHPEAGQKLEDMLPENDGDQGIRRTTRGEMKVHESRDQPKSELNRDMDATEFYEHSESK